MPQCLLLFSPVWMLILCRSCWWCIPSHLCFGFYRDNLSPSFIVNIVNGFQSLLYGDSERIKNYAVVTIFQNHKWFLMDFCISLLSFFHIRQETKIPGGLVRFQHLATPVLPQETKNSRGPGFTSKLKTHWLWQGKHSFSTASSEHLPPSLQSSSLRKLGRGRLSNTLGLRLENQAQVSPWVLLGSYSRCSLILCHSSQSTTVKGF